MAKTYRSTISKALARAAALAGRRTVRFAEWDLDVRRYELRRNGERVPVRPQAMDLLVLLVHEPGVLVTRSEIAKGVWGEAPPAHVDAAINILVGVLRGVLDDPAGQPRFVENVPGKGYRFIGRIRAVPVWWVVAAGVTLVGLVAAMAASLYTFAILSFVAGTVLLVVSYRDLPDTVLTRLGVSVFLIAEMAYIPSAWTLAPLLSSVINMDTLPPAPIYPVITGLKFICIPVLVLATWVLQRLNEDAGFGREPLLGRAYVVLGIVFITMTIAAIIGYSGDYRIWAAGVPERWTLLWGYAVVFLANVGLWVAAYGCFCEPRASGYQGLFIRCGIAYAVLVVGAIMVDAEYNVINRHYLDVRRGDAYVAMNPDAVEAVSTHSDVGPDLRALLAHPDFNQALRRGTFYKQPFDESFQIGARAVIFGYRSQPATGEEPPHFTFVRFPDSLARALSFQNVRNARAGMRPDVTDVAATPR